MQFLSLVVSFVVALTVNAEKEKRQILPTCTNAFTLTNNPCINANGLTYFPVPGDNTKFVQCDLYGGAYVVQCPVGQVYNQNTFSCRTPQTTVVNNPTGAALCTAQAVRSGQIYFTYTNDRTKFYECTAIGQVAIISCPGNLVWDQNRVSCVLPQGSQPLQPQVNNLVNPCTPQQIASNNLYFAHPDPTKFIQCDLVGNPHEMDCPTGLVWNQYQTVCASAFSVNVVG